MNVWFFLALYGGIVLGWNIPLSFNLSFILAISILTFLITNYKYNKHFLFLSMLIVFFVFLGVLWIKPYTILKPFELVGKEHACMIKISSLVQRKGNKQVYSAYINKADNIPVELKVKVNDFHIPAKQYGQRYQVQGLITRKQFGQSFFYTLWLKKESPQQKISLSSFAKFINAVHLHQLRYFKDNLSEPAYGFISSVILGRRELLDREIRNIVQSIGGAHLLAISGLHLGVFSFFILFMLKLIGFPFKYRLITSILVVFIYTVLTGAAASTVRAFIMYTAVCVSYLLRRKVSLFSSFGLAGLLSLLMNPLWVFDIGFQFSYLSVGGILIGYHAVNKKYIAKQTVLRFFQLIILSSGCVSLALFPLSAYYFGYIAPFSLVTNIVIIPIFSVLVILGYIFMSSYLLPWFSVLVAEVLSVGVAVLLGVCYRFQQLGLRSFELNISVPMLFLYYIILSLSIIILRYRRGICLFIIRLLSLRYSARNQE